MRESEEGEEEWERDGFQRGDVARRTALRTEACESYAGLVVEASERDARDRATIGLGHTRRSGMGGFPRDGKWGTVPNEREGRDVDGGAEELVLGETILGGTTRGEDVDGEEVGLGEQEGRSLEGGSAACSLEVVLGC